MKKVVKKIKEGMIGKKNDPKWIATKARTYENALRQIKSGSQVHEVANIRMKLKAVDLLKTSKGAKKAGRIATLNDTFKQAENAIKNSSISPSMKKEIGRQFDYFKKSEGSGIKKTVAKIKGGKIKNKKALIAAGIILTGMAAYKYYKSNKKGRWVSSEGKRFFIKG